MPTVPISGRMRLVVGRTLAWALLMGGWLVLGALGQMRLPHWAGGLAPVALWLGAAGIALYFGNSASLSAKRQRKLIVLAGLATAVALARAGSGGGAAAIASASISWGILLVAASRAVRMMRPCARRPPPPVIPAAAGAALAWIVAGAAAVEGSSATALWLAAMAALLAVLLPSGASGRGCRAGLFDCALPAAAWAEWRDPATWAAQSARWAMLPMMASLAVMAQWCGGDRGLTPSQAGGLHLGAMLLPPLALQLFRIRLQTDAWVAAAMMAGPAMLYFLPGLQGLMAASMCHSFAWGLAWFGRVSAPQAPCPPAPALNWMGALAPAGCVWALGLAIAGSGPSALSSVHVGLGVLAAVGATASLWGPASIKMEKSP